MTPANQVKIFIAHASKLGARLFRANTGLAWAGDPITTKTPRQITLRPGDVLLSPGRPFKAGVEGMSDATGWNSITITPDMVGEKIAVYVAVEAKFGKGRASDPQKRFIQAVQLAGGRAGVARSEEDVERILRGD